ncbi:NAD-dependent epimerase [Leeia oryzae]|uniref:NAD-dependent epimerase n=1 Tax=Leeia oryzae TaxID=356662 RepID=UPI00035DB579|nr:NAD-dependent epimerase [Leeia oryzae]
MKILVTGAAGFIGMHVAERLLARGDEVVGIDNLNSYYDPALKEARLARLTPHANFRFEKMDIADAAPLMLLFAKEKFDAVINLAAQAGVRYSLENPRAYVASNLTGFVNVLEACRQYPVRHLVYASSSSVYGANQKVPFSESDSVDHPVSLYAATKKSNELMAHTYSHLFNISTTGLRFFTVYGPWGRPDMAYWSFTKKILAGETIPVFNHGQLRRDFTYIDDIVEGIIQVLDRPATPDAEFDRLAPQPATSFAPYRVFNIGNHNPVPLMTFIETLEKVLGKVANKEFLSMQPGDVEATYADTERLQQLCGFAPSTSLEDGLMRFAKWYENYNIS